MRSGHAGRYRSLALAGCLALASCAGVEPEGTAPLTLPVPALPAAEAAPPEPVVVPEAVHLGATREAIEAVLGEPTRVVEDASGVETVHLLGLPEPVVPASSRAVLARRAVSTVGSLLGPVGAIGSGLASQALGGAAPEAERDLSRAVMITIDYRNGKATRISRQKLGVLELARIPAS
ncbi:hypothetical protein [Benzoatithermus flavus]|uniref:Uncharacterized protein n=1 Tax=Benzoatithermus flavus TaxID=3108223 RepID=A0ABU8XN48_9PROT